MADLTVKNAVCPTCGADIREGALFCYGCGKSVPETGSDMAAKTLQFTSDDFAGAADSAPVPRPDIPPSSSGDNMESSAPTENGKGLRTASSMRRRPKTLERKNIEVAWVTPDRPSPLFFIVSITLGLAAVTLIALAIYFR